MLASAEVRAIEYPLSPNYIPDWGIRDALRELIANALDTETKVEVRWAHGFAYIEDSGPGIPQSFWVLGEGNGGVIGQFHEGLKLAMLVLARENVAAEVQTVGYSAGASIKESETFGGAKLMQLEFRKSLRLGGTCVRVECSKEAIAAAEGLFLMRRPRPWLSQPLGILDAPGELYITGVFVQTIDALWGYDVTDKKLANRDRSVLDMTGVQSFIARQLRQLKSVPMLKTYLMGSDSVIERQIALYVEEDTKPAWKRAFREVYGSKACLSGDSFHDKYVSSQNWSVLQLPWEVTHTLGSAGIEDSVAVARRLQGQRFAWPQAELTVSERAVLEKAKAIAKSVVPDVEVASTSVVEAFPDEEGIDQTAMGMQKGKTVYIRRAALKSLSLATGTLIHERLHMRGLMDATRQFEWEMTLLLGQLAVKAGGL